MNTANLQNESSREYMIPSRIFIYGFLLMALILGGILSICATFIKLLYPYSWWLTLIGCYLGWKGFIYPLQKWILGNVTCFDCGNKLAKCAYNYQIKNMMSFKVYCNTCKKMRILETGVFDRILRFVDYITEVKAEIATEKTSVICPIGHIDLGAVVVGKKTLKEISGINFCLDKELAKNIEVSSHSSPADGRMSFYISETQPDTISLTWGTYESENYEKYLKNIKDGLPDFFKDIEILKETDLQFEDRNIIGKQVVFNARVEGIAEEYSHVTSFRALLKCGNKTVIIEASCSRIYPKSHEVYEGIINTLQPG